jgi:hypothetical protein
MNVVRKKNRIQCNIFLAAKIKITYQIIKLMLYNVAKKTYRRNNKNNKDFFPKNRKN